jgi:DNA repair ATPase RecN
MILGLQIENAKKIRVAAFDFNGKHLVQLRGRNEAGKSTVIEALEALFKGGSISKDLISRGEKKAVITSTFLDYTARFY